MRTYLSVLVLPLLLAALGCDSAADGTSSSNEQSVAAEDAYDFPIRPGMDAWHGLESHNAMLEALQVPPERLAQMSTAGLADTCLSYPLYRDMYAFNDMLTGFQRMATGFNAFDELRSRDDAGRLLLARYETMAPAAIDPAWTLEQMGDYDAQITNIELLLAQETSIAKLTDAEIARLVRAGLATVTAKAARAEVYGARGRLSTAFLIGRAMWLRDIGGFRRDVAANAPLGAFIERADWSDLSPAEQVIERGMTTLGAEQ